MRGKGRRSPQRMIVRAVLCFLAANLLTSAGAAQAGARNQLWPVVRTCASAYRMLGVAFPCLAVDLPGGDLDRGYAVLRPLRSDDLILSPTRQTPGVEDPFLQSPEAATLRRGLACARVSQRPGRKPASARRRRARGRFREYALADQLHIHIGCLRSDVRRFLDQAAQRMPLYDWSRVGPGLGRQVYYGVRVRASDFDKLKLFRLAAHGFAGAAENPGGLMILVVGAQVKGEDDFLILASFEGASRASRTVGRNRCSTAAAPRRRPSIDWRQRAPANDEA